MYLNMHTWKTFFKANALRKQLQCSDISFCKNKLKVIQHDDLQNCFFIQVTVIIIHVFPSFSTQNVIK